ncbi:hypothetical protein ACA910_017634 [Epithemia clementina (nom. ined.)]
MKLSTIAFLYLFSLTTAQSHFKNPNIRRSVASVTNVVEEQHTVDEASLPSQPGIERRAAGPDPKGKGPAERRAAGPDPKGKGPAGPETDKKAKQPTDPKQPSDKQKTSKNSGGGSSSSSSSTYVAPTSALDSALCSCQAFKDATTGYWHTGSCTCNPNNSETDENGHVKFSCQGTRSGVSFTQDGRMYYYCPDGRRNLRA